VSIIVACDALGSNVITDNAPNCKGRFCKNVLLVLTSLASSSIGSVAKSELEVGLVIVVVVIVHGFDVVVDVDE